MKYTYSLKVCWIISVRRLYTSSTFYSVKFNFVKRVIINCIKLLLLTTDPLHCLDSWPDQKTEPTRDKATLSSSPIRYV